jgi:hypothetical protein
MTRMTIVRGLAAATSILAVAAPSALAAKPAPGAPPCAARPFTAIFGAYADKALYTLAPDGGLEAGGAGWTLGAGASVVGESSSIALADPLGTRSLQLAPGATATSPAVCVERGYPAFRFVHRALAAGVTLRVQVIYGAERKVRDAGTIKPAAGWSVSPALKLEEGQFQVQQGESAEVRFRFTAAGGTARVDDVYVDPRLRR